jgi:hypothetical protein
LNAPLLVEGGLGALYAAIKKKISKENLKAIYPMTEHMKDKTQIETFS